MSGKNKDELVFVPLGGLGEIGMNFAMYGFGPADKKKWIIADCGVTFPGPELPGVDLVFPDIRFAEREKDNILAIVITHAHEDHYGALLDLWPRLQVPVYATAFTVGLLEAKRAYERGIQPDIPVTLYGVGETFEIGPFSIEAVAVTHSIPEPVSLAITTPLGTIIHTGDWKIDPEPSIGPLTNENRFRELGKKGVLALICDSTNSMREGDSPSEQDVGESLRQLIEEAKGRVAITTFSSNVGRIRSIAEAARDADRKVIVLGSSMRRVISVASELGYLDGLPPFAAEEDFAYLDRDKVVILCTGSQGEPRAAVAKLSRGELRNIAFAAGDTLIYSSRVIPGNEKPILETKNRLVEMGVRIIEDDDALVHVSGHPRRNELRQMYGWVKPQIAIPVHGEAAHLVAHGDLATSEGVPNVIQARNGDVVRLAPNTPDVIDQVPSGRYFKDGDIIGKYEDVGISERRKLGYVGHVSALVELDERFELADDPDVVAYGIPIQDIHGQDFEETLITAAIGAVKGIPRGRRKNLDIVEEAVRRAIRAAARDVWGKKPVTTVFVTRP